MQASWRHSRPETSSFQWRRFKGRLHETRAVTIFALRRRRKQPTAESAFAITLRTLGGPFAVTSTTFRPDGQYPFGTVKSGVISSRAANNSRKQTNQHGSTRDRFLWFFDFFGQRGDTVETDVGQSGDRSGGPDRTELKCFWIIERHGRK